MGAAAQERNKALVLETFDTIASEFDERYEEPR